MQTTLASDIIHLTLSRWVLNWSLFFVGKPSDAGSMVCWHSGARCASVASASQVPSKAITNASAVARMFAAKLEAMLAAVMETVEVLSRLNGGLND